MLNAIKRGALSAEYRTNPLLAAEYFSPPLYHSYFLECRCAGPQQFPFLRHHRRVVKDGSPISIDSRFGPVTPNLLLR
jgi:hypothetical protein